jgi:hypothetical protein
MTFFYCAMYYQNGKQYHADGVYTPSAGFDIHELHREVATQVGINSSEVIIISVCRVD